MMIPLAVPNLTGNERKYLNECIDTTFVSSVGEFVSRLEGDAAKATGAVDAVATSAGTTALHAALIVLGVRPGDLVIVPSFTFIASANAIRHAGADPWLFDICADSWCIDLEQVNAELSSKCIMRNGVTYHRATMRRVSAMMPVYTLGNIPDMDKARLLCREWNLALLADAACAIGATYKGRDIAELADLSAISLNGNKTITAGGGGLVVGQSKELLDEVRHITTTARIWPNYDFDQVGYNYRLTNLQAAVAVAQFERLESFIARKRQIRCVYEEAFSDMKGLSTFPSSDDCESGCWFSGIVLDDESITNECVGELNAAGVGARAFWKPIHLQQPYLNCPTATSLDRSANLWGKVITLPCSTGISDEELTQVIDAVKRAASSLNIGK